MQISGVLVSEEDPMSVSARYESQPKTPLAMDMFHALWGFIAFVVTMVVSYLYQDIRPFLLTTCLAFSGAGFYRAGTRPQGRLRTALFVGLGGILPAITMNRLGIAWTDIPFVALFMLASLLDAALGILLRSLISRDKMKHALVLGCIWTLAVLAVVYKAVPDWVGRRAYVIVDRDITPFRIQTLTGKSVSSEEWKGHVVVLSFWATWCTPCHAELPEVQALQNKYRGNPNVLIFALDSATGGDTSAKAQAYLDRKKLTLTGTIDSLGADRDSWGPAAKSLNIKGIPTIYVLDRSGRLKGDSSGI
ncbi:MAG TPA: TlpA disulfide reductase family protein [Candidatus Elarobacter sp.]|nr:TlpA disulfide reductase family protein [Candidatus Elarobacter sp.]